ncbi:aminoacyl-histidine dipeptidase [Paludibacter jiangxiensis]|uniref:Cytosol non-specific dipeptidase n=1 Tax=Paludibacter jiangxiensis TaxID=681398 RepID=A0A161LD78_9BACT|nr:aminoacyl-histidine dipeptidase [Paludibacter jiangxiensis]GAT62045.1 dipeptidase D [Paludibacter jiangxiensis]
MEKNRAIEQLQPVAVWQNFKALTQIPRPSGKRDLITKYLVDFGKNLGLESFEDEAGNVIIRKPATPGLENLKGVVLQAHMDMVPQKNAAVAHDFEKDPIDAFVDGEWVRANQTTLGADNGIGVASALAVLQSKDLTHGPVEVLITADEETGMFGAVGLKNGTLKGEVLLNLDSEDEGELYVGCAGGINAHISFAYKEEPVYHGDVAYKISLTGLKGGHSGLDINLGRANANKLLFRLLKYLVSSFEARLASVEGGNLRNAIPREAFAVVTVPEEGQDDLLEAISEMEAIFKSEYASVEPDLKIIAEEVDLPEGMLPEFVQDDLINGITACPNGVLRFVPEMPEVVETSTNLAIVKSDGSHVEVACLVRSSVESMKEELCSMIESVFSLAGAKVEFSGGYPGWQPHFDSPILKVMSQVYADKFGNTPEIKVIHAGLECGIIGSAVPGLDMISFGPTIRHPHSPDEKVNIATVAKFWDYLTAVLKAIPAK